MCEVQQVDDTIHEDQLHNFLVDALGGVKIQTRRSTFEVSMPEIDRLTESTDWIGLGFVERKRTPRAIIEKGIRHHLAGLSLSNTATLLDDLGIDRSRVAVHNWVRKADLQPSDGENPDRIAVDQFSRIIETVRRRG